MARLQTVSGRDRKGVNPTGYRRPYLDAAGNNPTGKNVAKRVKQR